MLAKTPLHGIPNGRNNENEELRCSNSGTEGWGGSYIYEEQHTREGKENTRTRRAQKYTHTHTFSHGPWIPGFSAKHEYCKLGTSISK